MDLDSIHNPQSENIDTLSKAYFKASPNETSDSQLASDPTSINNQFSRDIIPFNNDIGKNADIGKNDIDEKHSIDTDTPNMAFEDSSFSIPATLVARKEILNHLPALQSREPLEVHEVLKIRNALKLATKFFSDSRLPWTAECSVPSCSHVAEVGIMLALTGADHEVIEAGLLGHESIESIKEKGILEKKFSPQVTPLISEITALLMVSPEELGEKLHKIYEEDKLLAQRLATLHCAIMSARAEKNLSHPQAEALAPVYYSFGVSLDLINQYNVFTGNARDVYPSNQTESAYSMHEIIDIRKSLRLASIVYKDSLRKWGPEEKIPLISHAAEVGLLLALAGKSRDVVVAGLLHDFLEGYVNDEISDLGREVDAYGPEVRSLVQEITEPQRREIQGKSETREAWQKRKNAIIERLESGSTDFADLCAATKISTIAAGNKMLFEDGKFEKWSNGPIEDNLSVFIKINEACASKGISPVLAGQLELETDRLILLSIKTSNKLAEVA